MLHKVTLQKNQVVSWSPVETVDTFFDAPEWSYFEAQESSISPTNPYWIVVVSKEEYEKKQEALQAEIKKQAEEQKKVEEAEIKKLSEETAEKEAGEETVEQSKE